MAYEFYFFMNKMQALIMWDVDIKIIIKDANFFIYLIRYDIKNKIRK